ncbi:2-keto-4-pentenoate hydratase, partial [Nocardia fluminea]
MLPDAVRTQLADELARAEADRVAVAPLVDRFPDIDVVDAYEIQLLNIQRRLRTGARIIGHKVGLSSKAMQQMMGVDEPDYGHLLADMEV